MKPPLPGPVDRMMACYARGGVHDPDDALPDRESVARLCLSLTSLLFPGFFSGVSVPRTELEAHTRALLEKLRSLLVESCGRARRMAARRSGGPEPVASALEELVAELLEELVTVRELVETDVEAAFRNDPSAIDRETILLSYPSIEALAVQRFAHRLYLHGVPVVPRMMTEVVHRQTGIDIHPGAAIDESFFIDHGTGVVVGETSRIGRHCVLYQGVTLGALNPLATNDQDELVRGQGNKRHPDLEEKVTVYAGATILGGSTVIGHHSVIGGSVWLTRSVEPYTKVLIKEPELVISKRKMKRAPRAP